MPRADLTETIVIRAAADLADREGFAAVTVSAVAREFNVQPASLYEYVKSRDALLDGVQRLALGELRSWIEGKILDLSGPDALRGLIDAHRRMSVDHPGLWEALQRKSSPETARSPESVGLSSVVLAVARSYPVSDPVHAARLIAATIHGFVSLTQSEAFAYRSEETDISWIAVADALDRALSTWPKGAY